MGRPHVPTPPDNIPSSASASRIIGMLLLLLAGLSPAWFALATGNIWEDFFIMFRYSLNLAESRGLVYEAGRTLHVGSSPLDVLLPAQISWGLQSGDAVEVLGVFRGSACVALIGAWWLASRSIRQIFPLRFPRHFGCWIPSWRPSPPMVWRPPCWRSPSSVCDRPGRIGEESTFEVDIVPPKLFKRQIVRPKFRRRTVRRLPPVLARVRQFEEGEH